jgi:hypothetical protein
VCFSDVPAAIQLIVSAPAHCAQPRLAMLCVRRDDSNASLDELPQLLKQLGLDDTAANSICAVEEG